MAAIPTTTPQTVVAGDLVQFTRSWGDYPAGTWSAEWIIPGLATVAATASGTDHLFSVAAATSAAWAAGTYQCWFRVTSGAAVHTVEVAAFRVEADPSAATSQAGELADVIAAITAMEAVLANRATQDQRRYRIGDRELERVPVAELMQLLAHYRGRRRTIEARLGIAGASGKMLARFTGVR